MSKITSAQKAIVKEAFNLCYRSFVECGYNIPRAELYEKFILLTNLKGKKFRPLYVDMLSWNKSRFVMFMKNREGCISAELHETIMSSQPLPSRTHSKARSVDKVEFIAQKTEK